MFARAAMSICCEPAPHRLVSGGQRLFFMTMAVKLTVAEGLCMQSAESGNRARLTASIGGALADEKAATTPTAVTVVSPAAALIGPQRRSQCI